MFVDDLKNHLLRLNTAESSCKFSCSGVASVGVLATIIVQVILNDTSSFRLHSIQLNSTEYNRDY